MKTGIANSNGIALGALLLLAAVGSRGLAEETSAVGTPSGLVTIPTPPSLPHTLSIGDEVDGRHLLYDTRFAYQKAPSLTFEAQWAAAGGAPGDVVPAGRSGSEKLSCEIAARRISLTTEDDQRNGGRKIRRTISDGSNMISTRFEQTSAAAAPARSYLQLPIDDTTTVQRALAQVQVSPETRGADFALIQTGDIMPASAIVWRAGAETVDGSIRADIVDEFDNRSGTIDANQERYCRFLIDADTHRLLRFESWEIDVRRPRPARHYRPKDASGAVVGPEIDVAAYPASISYRRETYNHVARATTPLNSALWALAVPANYKADALPSVNLPPITPPATGMVDPRALALIAKWREASQRYLTLSTSVNVLEHFEQRTEDSRTMTGRFGDSKLQYEVTIRRPGRARVSVHTIAGGMRRRIDSRDGVAACDGHQVVAVMDGDRRTRTFLDQGPIYSYILQAGLRDPYNALYYLFNTAPDVQYYDRISFDGSQLLDGRERVQIVSLHRTLNRGNQASKADEMTRCFLGEDGMPREIETHTVIDLNGRLERDQPPSTMRTVRYQNLLLDSTPTVSFTIP